MKMIQAGALYFGVVFAAGFVLGIVRTLWVAPRLGTRAAELVESPVMLAISILAARWVIDFLALPPRLPARIGMGLIALALMLAAETGLVLRMRRLSLRGYLETRDRVSGAVYYALLVVFALLPTFIGT